MAHEGRRLLKRGFNFNLMVVGESGLGKTTLVNTLFRSPIARTEAGGPQPSPKTTEVHTVTHVIEEKGVRLKLTVTDCPGFGDQVRFIDSIDTFDSQNAGVNSLWSTT